MKSGVYKSEHLVPLIVGTWVSMVFCAVAIFIVARYRGYGNNQDFIQISTFCFAFFAVVVGPAHHVIIRLKLLNFWGFAVAAVFAAGIGNVVVWGVNCFARVGGITWSAEFMTLQTILAFMVNWLVFTVFRHLQNGSQRTG